MPQSRMGNVLLATLVVCGAVNTTSAQAPEQSQQILTGVVVDARGQPVAHAYVFDRGSARFSVANANGEFRLPASSRGGALTIGARRLGYEPQELTLSEARATEPVRFIMNVLPVKLQSVDVRASGGGYSEDLDRDGFYRRMAKAIEGTFITPAQIEKRNPPEISQMLNNVPGVHLMTMSPRHGVKNSVPLGRGGLCVMGLVLDGKRLEYEAPSVEAIQPRIPAIMNGQRVVALHNESGGAAGTFDELLPTSMVRAIEVYPSAASVPTEFKGEEKGCGLIVIWTQSN